MKYIAFALLAVLLFAAYVRLSPMPATRWHQDPQTAPGPGPRGSFRTTLDLPEPPEQVLASLDRIAMATPRTSRLAGSVASGRISYVTRTKLWGFPDVTTVEAHPAGEGSRLIVFARLRFGRGDVGVNRARVEDWLRRLGAR